MTSTNFFGSLRLQGFQKLHQQLVDLYRAFLLDPMPGTRKQNFLPMVIVSRRVSPLLNRKRQRFAGGGPPEAEYRIPVSILPRVDPEEYHMKVGASLVFAIASRREHALESLHFRSFNRAGGC